MKKIFSIFMAMLFAVTCSFTSVNALSANDKGTITVTGLEKDAKVELYKIVDVRIGTNGEPIDPMYTWTTDAVNFIKSTEGKDTDYTSYLKEVTLSNNTKVSSVTDAFKNVTAADESVFLNDLASYLTSPTYSETSKGSSFSFEGSAMGEYLIKVTKPDNSKTTYQVTTAKLVPTYEESAWDLKSPSIVNVKSSTEDLKKDVNKETVKIGDVVKYTITTTLPYYADKTTDDNIYRIDFVVGDSLDSGLDYVLTEGSFKPTVTLGDTTLTNSDYDLTWNSDNARTFEIKIKSDTAYANRGKTLKVSYSATVNSNAFASDTTGNSVYTNQKNNPWEDTTTKHTTDKDVHTYGIQLTKVDDTDKTLAGAKFSLNDGTSTLKFTGSNGEYTYAANQNANEGVTSDLEVSAGGKLLIKGINVGTYTLTETKAATGGYALPDGKITVKVVDKDKNGELTLANDSVTFTGTAKATDASVDNNTILFKVVNIKTSDFELPNTGGVGTMIFTVAGMLLMAGAVVYLTVSHKKA